MKKEENDNVGSFTSTVVSGRDMALEAVKRGKGTFTMDLLLAEKVLDNTVEQAADLIRQAYAKDKDTSFAVNLTDHATICFSFADGKLRLAHTVGTGHGIKCLCDMLPAWFKEHYDVTVDGGSVKPRSE